MICVLHTNMIIKDSYHRKNGSCHACGIYFVEGSAADLGLIPGSGRSPGEGNGKPLQYPGLENPMDRGAWGRCSPWGHKELGRTERVTDFCFLVSSESSALLIFMFY